MNPNIVDAMPEAYRAIVENRPAWATAAFAIAVFGGAFGCLLLLLRKWLGITCLLYRYSGQLPQKYRFLEWLTSQSQP